MNINWVIADGYHVDPTIDLTVLQNIGPIWGSWRTWRSCGTDNVICHNTAKAQELIQRDFQKNCNFFVPEKNFKSIGRPNGVQVYGGEFNEETNSIEDIIALHLSSSKSEIILLLGFNLQKISTEITDKFELHKIKNYYGLTRSLIASKSEIQFVLVDHPGEPDKSFQDLANLTCDTLENVLQLLAQ
jgi:hypothetical protein